MTILILSSWLCIFFLMIVAWGIYLMIENPGIIDAFWPLSITLSGINYLLSNKHWPLIIYIYAVLLVTWCIRLAGHLLFTRIIPDIKEKRYIELSNNWRLPPKLAFFLHFQFQGLLALIIATPFLWIRDLSQLTITSILSFILIIIGTIGESIADMQLFRFKKRPTGKVCNTGLWRYSRHPNYFFEICVWFGFGLGAVSIAHSLSFIALISPTLLLFLMLKITGPITEKASLRSRGEAFKQYQKETSYFIPYKKKRSN